MSDRKYTADSIGDRLEEFLSSLLDQAGLRLDYRVYDSQPSPDDFETPEVVVKFSGGDVDLLLANKAELLLALEHLSMEMLRMPSDDHSRLCFDANDYRLLRIEELRLSASAAAEKVKRTGVPFRFNPMNSRERRVIHLALRNDSEVRSESTGSGPSRQVVIYPAGMPSAPEPPGQQTARPERRSGPPRSKGRSPRQQSRTAHR